ncbi:MAG: DUF5411 family protein [Bacilli bacterium]
MNQSMWGIFFVIIGVLGIFFINLFEDITSTNDQNYYLLKETTQAAMFDSIDLAQFREYGTLRIVKEKFVENFTRRFAESTNIQKNYNIKFREIIEEPPKVTIEIGSASRVTFTEDDFDINIKNVLDAILETNWVGDETNQPTLKGCHIKYIAAYTYKCKKITTVCEPIYSCSGWWETITTYGHRYERVCENRFTGEPIRIPCGLCVELNKTITKYNLACPPGTTATGNEEGTCVLSTKKVCHGNMIKTGESCSDKMLITTCYEPAKYEIVCD